MERCEGDDGNKRLSDGTMGAIMLSRGGEVRRSEGGDEGEDDEDDELNDCTMRAITHVLYRR